MQIVCVFGRPRLTIDMNHSRTLAATLALFLTSCFAFATLSTQALALSSEAADAGELLDKGDFVGAKTLLEAQVAESPKDAAAWQKLGQAYFGLRWFEDSETSFAKADELKPDDGLTLYYRGALVLIATRARDKDARAFFDRSASLESPVQDSAHLMKFAMMKYISIRGRSVSKEFDAWRKGLDQESWIGQTSHYMRRPVSNDKYTAQRATHSGEMDERDLDLQMHLFIGLRCERTLYGLAADSFKAGMIVHRPGSVEWELCRVWYGRIGQAYNWDTKLGYKYAPNESGALQVAIQDRDSLAMARGLQNGDVILEINDQPADFNLLDAILKPLEVGDTYELRVQRGDKSVKLVMIIDTVDYRMRAVMPK